MAEGINELAARMRREQETAGAAQSVQTLQSQARNAAWKRARNQNAAQIRRLLHLFCKFARRHHIPVDYYHLLTSGWEMAKNETTDSSKAGNLITTRLILRRSGSYKIVGGPAGHPDLNWFQAEDVKRHIAQFCIDNHLTWPYD